VWDLNLEFYDVGREMSVVSWSYGPGKFLRVGACVKEVIYRSRKRKKRMPKKL
jgi:hypothetical protein